MPDPTNALVLITDAVIDGLAADPAAAGLPPSLFAALVATKAKVARMCSRCGRTQAAKQALAEHYAAIRAAIAALHGNPAAAAPLKAALSARQVRVVSGRNHEGAEVRWTF